MGMLFIEGRQNPVILHPQYGYQRYEDLNNQALLLGEAKQSGLLFTLAEAENVGSLTIISDKEEPPGIVGYQIAGAQDRIYLVCGGDTFIVATYALENYGNNLLVLRWAYDFLADVFKIEFGAYDRGSNEWRDFEYFSSINNITVENNETRDVTKSVILDHKGNKRLMAAVRGNQLILGSDSWERSSYSVPAMINDLNNRLIGLTRGKIKEQFVSNPDRLLQKIIDLVEKVIVPIS